MGQSKVDSDGLEIREAERGDADGIRAVASQSMHASYDEIIGAEAIDTAVEKWYGDDALEAELDEEGLVYVVAVAGDEVVGFSQNLVADGTGTVLWLHVDPDNRDKNVGTTLLNHTQATLSERGVDRIAAEVLSANEPGCSFYEGNGFEKTGEREKQIGEETFVENVYVHQGEVVYEPREFEGRTLHVNWAESERGSDAPFYAAYTEEDGDDLWGWFCSNCESFDTVMDSMERLECNDCGNQKKPVRWDAAYL